MPSSIGSSEGHLVAHRRSGRCWEQTMGVGGWQVGRMQNCLTTAEQGGVPLLNGHSEGASYQSYASNWFLDLVWCKPTAGLRAFRVQLTAICGVAQGGEFRLSAKLNANVTVSICASLLLTARKSYGPMLMSTLPWEWVVYLKVDIITATHSRHWSVGSTHFVSF